MMNSMIESCVLSLREKEQLETAQNFIGSEEGE